MYRKVRALKRVAPIVCAGAISLLTHAGINGGAALAAETCSPNLDPVLSQHDATLQLLTTRQTEAISSFKVSYASVARLDDEQACLSIRRALEEVLEAHRARMVKEGRLPPLDVELSREAFAEATPFKQFSEPVSVTQFMNMPVTTALGDDIGKVVDVRIDPRTGRWLSFVVGKISWLGGVSGERAVSVSRLRFDEQKKLLMVLGEDNAPASTDPTTDQTVAPNAANGVDVRDREPSTTVNAGTPPAGPRVDQAPALPAGSDKKIDNMPTRVLKVD